jgi:hypothetical protein
MHALTQIDDENSFYVRLCLPKKVHQSMNATLDFSFCIGSDTKSVT